MNPLATQTITVGSLTLLCNTSVTLDERARIPMGYVMHIRLLNWIQQGINKQQAKTLQRRLIGETMHMVSWQRLIYLKTWLLVPLMSHAGPQDKRLTGDAA